MSTTIRTATDIRTSVSTLLMKLAQASPHRGGGAGPPKGSSRIGRKACGRRRFRRLPTTGRPTTTGARPKRGSMRSPQFATEDRRGRDSLHPRQIVARERVAAGHDARLARLGHRTARDRRPAHRPDRARWGRAEDAFHLVLPSLPGCGFSGKPAELGWDAGRIARAWAELMHRLGYTRYVAQGGDVGALVNDMMGRQAVEPGRIPPEPAHGGARNRRSTAQGVRTGTRRGRGAREFRSDGSATSSRWQRGRRRSATPCWIHPSGWRPGCSTTTRTATTRSPARSSTAARG